MCGTDRMLAALKEKSDATPPELLANVKKSMDEFVADAEQFNDITMLALDWHDRV